MNRFSIRAASVAFVASMGVAMSVSPASGQPLGGGNQFRYELDPNTFQCYRVDTLRNYRIWVEAANCIQDEPGINLPVWASSWIFVTDTGEDPSTTASGDITIVYGLDPNQGIGDPGLAGMTPSDHEYSLAGDDEITSRLGNEVF